MLQDLKQRIGSWFGRKEASQYSEQQPVAGERESVPPKARRHFDVGLQRLRESRPAEALACFNDAIASSWNFAEAHHHAGLALKALGRNDEAVTSFQHAIDIKHDYTAALCDQGTAYLNLGQYEDASDCFHVALAYAQNCAEAHLGLGTIYQRQKRTRDAIQQFQCAAQLDPRSPVPLVNLSAIMQEEKQYADALAYLERAAALAPDVAELECNLGVLLLRLHRPQEAVVHLQRAVTLKADFPAAHLNLGNALCQCDMTGDAIECSRRAVELKAEYPEAHRNLGNAYRLRGEVDKALVSSQTALSLKPDYAEAQLDIGAALYDQGRVHEALAAYQRALALRPDYPEAQLNLGLACLAAADFEHGWVGYEWRFRQTDPDNRVVRRALSWPEWQGEDLAGKSILVWAEQGISDQLMFASLFGEIVGAARHCVIECARKLVPLLKRSFPAADVVPLTDPPRPEAQRSFDYQIAAGSAARWLRPTLESFPKRAGYLVADGRRVEYWRRRLDGLGAGLKVGFSWRSGNLRGVRALFSTQLEQWGDLFRIPGVHWICLQYDECRSELETAGRQFGLKLHRFENVDYLDDLDELSALMKALDLVISAPTAVSVQAAALGVEVWQMNYGLDWQTHGTSGNPWFPTMVRYERRANRSWSEVIVRVAHQLEVRAR